MPELSTETEIALLKSRMDNVEEFVKTAPEKFVTHQEAENMIAQSVPSREDIKSDMTEAFTMALASQGNQKREDRKETRQWVIEILKILATVIGTGGLITIYQIATAGIK